MRLVRLAIVLVDDVGRGIIRREPLDDVGTGADRGGHECFVLVRRVVVEGVCRVEVAVVATRERLEPRDRRALEGDTRGAIRSDEHTTELQSRENRICRLLLE